MNIQAPPNLSLCALPRADRSRHQRLGRRLAGHARSRQPRSRLARDRDAGRRPLRRTARCWSSASRAIRPTSTPQRVATWHDAALRHAAFCAPPTPPASPATTTGRRASRLPTVPRPLRAAGDASGEVRSAELGRRSSTAPPPAAASTHADIVRLFEARGASWTRVARRRRRPAPRRRAATPSPTSSTATSTTPTSAPTSAASAPSRRAPAKALRGAPYDLDLDEIVRRAARGLGARRHRGLPAGRHPSRLHRRHLSRDLPRRRRRRCPTCTSTPSRRWR